MKETHSSRLMGRSEDRELIRLSKGDQDLDGPIVKVDGFSDPYFASVLEG
jgi:hypothetical protein